MLTFKYNQMFDVELNTSAYVRLQQSSTDIINFASFFVKFACTYCLVSLETSYVVTNCLSYCLFEGCKIKVFEAER